MFVLSIKNWPGILKGSSCKQMVPKQLYPHRYVVGSAITDTHTHTRAHTHTTVYIQHPSLLCQGLVNLCTWKFTFSRRKLEIFPPSGCPPLENWISKYFPWNTSMFDITIIEMYMSYINSMRRENLNSIFSLDAWHCQDFLSETQCAGADESGTNFEPFSRHKHTCMKFLWNTH
jgi:hypothetical protein